MALIDLFLSRRVKRGQLTVTHANGVVRRFGTSDPAFADVAIRFADRGAANFIVRNPGLGAAEAFMDGRMVVEQGDIRDLIELLTGNDPWEQGGDLLAPGIARRSVQAITHRIGRINMARASKRNVAHHYDLSDRLYDLFLDADRQYSCAYFTDPANDLERAQADKKAHIAAKLAIEPGMTVLDIGCGWGGMALYLHRKDWGGGAGRDAQRGTAEGRAPPRRRGGRRGQGAVRADRLPQRHGPVRPDRLGRHVRACRSGALPGVSFANAAICSPRTA